MNIHAVGIDGKRFIPKTGWRAIPLVAYGLILFLGSMGIFAVTQINLTTQVQGLLPVANGGTGLGTLTAHALYVGNTTAAPNVVSVGATDTVLMGSTGADPSFVSLTSCSGAGNAVTYNTSTHAWGCATGYGVIPTFVDNETPTGACNNSNQTFTLAHTPSPATSLQLFYNGQLTIAGGADYTLATATITSVFTCKSGDVLEAAYRY